MGSGSILIYLKGTQANLNEGENRVITDGYLKLPSFARLEVAEGDTAQVDEGDDDEDDSTVMIIVIVCAIIGFCSLIGIIYMYCFKDNSKIQRRGS